MNNSKPTQHQPPAGMNVGDIYYVLFRHKWKIIILALAGIAVSAAFHSRNQPPFESQAELFIQYVPESASETLAGSDRRVIVPGSGEAGIINSEIQILTSFDVAEATPLAPLVSSVAIWRRLRPAMAAASSWSRSNIPTRKWFNPFFRKS
jgi:uncharacterized protein involved in exopolysaccharide biosynthesis